jgi:diguanylate cyclase (GGDEF)-like protein/PAS domain S-box-containing protein
VRNLPWPARFFIGAIVCAATAVLVVRFPAGIPNIGVFVTLVVASVLASALKLRLPLGSSSSNLSISYAIDFASLLMVGADLAMVVTALSALTQSTFNTARRNPAVRVVFNMSGLVLTIQAAGWAFTLLGGRPGTLDVEAIVPLFGAVLVYYVLNTSAVAGVVGLSTSESIWRVWHSNFLWTAPSYFIGAGAAVAAAAAWTTGRGWVIPVTVIPVYLTYRSYWIYMERIALEQRHREEIQRLHAQTVDALRAARESEQRYALAAAGSNDGLWDWDLTTGAFYTSERWKLMIGLGAEAACARPEDWFRYVHPDDLAGLRGELERHVAGETSHFAHEYRICHTDGQDRWMLCRGVAVRDDADHPVRIAGSQTDLTDRRRIQDELAHAAMHDNLTGLANRAVFTQLLDAALERAHRFPEHFCVVLFIDLDHFKVINDSLGHHVGDQFLIAIAERLRRQLRPGDLLARLGGDEFAVLLEGVGEPRLATGLADRLQATLREPFMLDGHEICGSASVGIALGNTAYRNASELLRDADTAMYRAKAQGRSRCQTFDPSMHARAIERLTLETQLRRALERREIIVHYQPIVELESEEICGFEALVRWVKADGTIVYPSAFISIAEETAMIVPLTRLVLRDACHHVAEWQRAFDRPLTLAVNISTKLFDQPSLVADVREAIRSSGLVPGTLRLEITESCLVNNSDAVTRRLDELKAVPVELYLDDFGTGFSSLSCLHRYRLNALKIDQSFISRMGGAHNDSPIVASIVSLARELGMGVIAEGVETPHQARQLLSLDCPHAQGYLFSRPLSSAAAYELLSARFARPNMRVTSRTAAGVGAVAAPLS